MKRGRGVAYLCSRISEVDAVEAAEQFFIRRGAADDIVEVHLRHLVAGHAAWQASAGVVIALDPTSTPISRYSFARHAITF